MDEEIFGFVGNREQMVDKLHELLNKLKGKGSKEKVVKSFSMKPAWLKTYKEMAKAREESDTLANKANSLKRAFWSTIELETDDFNHNMRINTTTLEIEVLEE